ncbi:MAG: hypothetical protein IKQ41_11735 [Clostridia bacterium]|nr:hypothetical protein [Clostridia bacterium]
MIINAFPTGWGNLSSGEQGEEEDPVVLVDFAYTGDYILIDDDNGDWRLKLLTSGSLTFMGHQTVDLFAVGGGSGGSRGKYVHSDGEDTIIAAAGGGGAGGYTQTVSSVVLVSGRTYAVTIGEGGAAGTAAGGEDQSPGRPGAGGTTSMGNLISAEGGQSSGINWAGANGGSGGGGGTLKQTGDTNATYNAGNGGTNGGDGTMSGTYNSLYQGQGTTTKEFGESGGTVYAGGGGGGNSLGTTRTSGGSGGGGYGASTSQNATAGQANTGGGGGGGLYEGKAAMPGGSGILIIRNHRT